MYFDNLRVRTHTNSQQTAVIVSGIQGKVMHWSSQLWLRRAAQVNNRYGHMNAAPVGRGQYFGIGSVPVPVCSSSVFGVSCLGGL